MNQWGVKWARLVAFGTEKTECGIYRGNVFLGESFLMQNGIILGV
jgi:hypothetical protein